MLYSAQDDTSRMTTEKRDSGSSGTSDHLRQVTEGFRDPAEGGQPQQLQRCSLAPTNHLTNIRLQRQEANRGNKR
jgi:hypothetical protein